MAPKPHSLAQIRRQVATNRKSTLVMNESAFHRIERKNERFVHGRAIHRRDPEDIPNFSPPKVKKMQQRKKTKLRPKSANKPVEPAEPAIENWRRAGGDGVLSEDKDKALDAKPTRVIGLARVSSWELEAFKASAKSAIEEYGEAQDLVTQEVKDGMDMCADVYAVFRSELAAEVVKDGLQARLVEGRKLQVRYA